VSAREEIPAQGGNDVAPSPVLVPKAMLLATIFVTGNVVMMLEVVGTRVVGPYFGVGLYVWSALITVTLLALAAGYWLGGKMADIRRKPETLYRIIFLAAALTFAIPLARTPCLTLASRLGLRLGALLGSALLFGPALFLLGMVTPYATKLYTDRLEKLGSRVGLVYAVSTLGSFIGTIAMGFYLIPTFRISNILLALGFALLLLPAVFYIAARPKQAAAVGALLAVVLGLLLFFPRDPETGWATPGIKILHKSTSFYGELKVIEAGASRIFLIDGISQSGEDPRTHGALPEYVNDLDTLLARFNPRAQRVLLIGLGGGNMVHLLLQRGLGIDVVEIDRHVVTASEKYFGVDPHRVRITLDDGRRTVRTTRRRYDAVVMNAFNGESSPVHLLSREFFLETQRILNPGGILLINFVGYVEGPERQAPAAILHTLKSSFAWSRCYFNYPHDRFSNILFVAGRDPAPAAPAGDQAWLRLADREVVIAGWESAPVLTDDYNPVNFLNRVVYRQWRQLVMDSLGPAVLLE